MLKVILIRTCRRQIGWLRLPGGFGLIDSKANNTKIIKNLVNITGSAYINLQFTVQLIVEVYKGVKEGTKILHLVLH